MAVYMFLLVLRYVCVFIIYRIRNEIKLLMYFLHTATFVLGYYFVQHKQCFPG